MSVWICPVFWIYINTELILVLERSAAYISQTGKYMLVRAKPSISSGACFPAHQQSSVCQAQGKSFSAWADLCPLPTIPRGGGGNHLTLQEGEVEGACAVCSLLWRWWWGEAGIQTQVLWFGGLALGLHEAGAQRPPRPGFKVLSASSYINVGCGYGKTDLGFLP